MNRRISSGGICTIPLISFNHNPSSIVSMIPETVPNCSPAAPIPLRNLTPIEPIVPRVSGDLFSIKYINLARSGTEPDSSERVMITGAGSLNWNSFGPVAKVPDTLLEVNGSKISESDPQPTIAATGDDL